MRVLWSDFPACSRVFSLRLRFEALERHLVFSFSKFSAFFPVVCCSMKQMYFKIVAVRLHASEEAFGCKKDLSPLHVVILRWISSVFLMLAVLTVSYKSAT